MQMTTHHKSQSSDRPRLSSGAADEEDTYFRNSRCINATLRHSASPRLPLALSAPWRPSA